mmetsp:Transcript_6096/g.17762  ORF Transcript_6096/g.17762 Transcript_6096/m.17762 type:complete len:241 (-) Transcript_6096:1055-1777(-)
MRRLATSGRPWPSGRSLRLRRLGATGTRTTASRTSAGSPSARAPARPGPWGGPHRPASLGATTESASKISRRSRWSAARRRAARWRPWVPLPWSRDSTARTVVSPLPLSTAAARSALQLLMRSPAMCGFLMCSQAEAMRVRSGLHSESRRTMLLRLPTPSRSGRCCWTILKTTSTAQASRSSPSRGAGGVRVTNIRPRCSTSLERMGTRLSQASSRESRTTSAQSCSTTAAVVCGGYGTC